MCMFHLVQPPNTGKCSDTSQPAGILSPIRISRPNMQPTPPSQKVPWPSPLRSPRPPLCSLLICFLLLNSEAATRFLSRMLAKQKSRSICSGKSSKFRIVYSEWNGRAMCTIRVFAGRQGITPAFGYSAPHPSAGGNLTLLTATLPSTHYALC